MKTLTLLTLGIIALLIRWSRWLAVLQQKEYRLDRLLIFFRSAEGKQEFRRLLPQKTDFSRTGFKRPRPTPRILLAGLTSIALVMFWGWLGWLIIAPQALIVGLLILLCWIILLYLLLPVFVLVAAIPTAAISQLLTIYYLKRAAKLFAIHQPFVIGITGSYGKTSTKLLLHKVLGGDSQVFATPGSHNTKLSVVRAILNHYQGQPIAIIEYAAYTQNEIKELTKYIQPNQAVITGLAEQHLALFGSKQQIISAKAELVGALPEKSSVFYNQDDPGALAIVQAGFKLRADKGQQLKLVGYGLTTSQKWGLNSAGISPHGHLEAVIDHQIVKFQLVGEHYLSNLLAAVTVGEAHNIKPAQAWERLTLFEPTSNFTRRVQLNTGAILIDDGSTSNPAGFMAIIGLAERITAQTKILLTAGIIDLGSESEKIHQQLAKKASQVFDRAWYVGETGKAQFQQEFGADFLADQPQILSALEQLNSRDLLVVEGKLPAWLTDLVEKSKQ